MKPILTLALLLTFSARLFAQTIQTVSPTTANAGQTLNVTVTGNQTHFEQGTGGTTLDFGFNQCSGTVNSITINSTTSLVANITVPSYIVNGKYDMDVWSAFDGTITLDKFFQINAPVANVTFSPDNAMPGETVIVTVTGHGTYFVQSSGSTGIDFGQTLCNGIDFSATNTFIDNDTVMQGHVTIPVDAPLGWYDVYLPGEFYDYPNVFRVGYPTGINEANLTETSTLSPNPFSGNTYLSVNSAMPAKGKLVVYDLIGREIYKRENIDLVTGSNNITLSSENFYNIPGAYTICLIADNKKYFAKAMLVK